MHTVPKPPVITPEPQAATPYFLLPADPAARVEEIAQWYAGGLPPDPLAA